MASPESITKALGGRWSGGRGVAFCPAHENWRTPALSLGESRDGRLLLHCFAGCAFGEVLAALRARGLVGDEDCAPDPARLERRRLIEQAARREEAQRSESAARLWSRTLEIQQTQAEAYLKARGISCALPPVLRFAPSLKHPSGAAAPAMVACMRCGRPGRLAVAEGIETALAAGMGLEEGWSLWAALSASGMTGLILPPDPGELLVCADGDAPGRRAAQALARRALAAGWRARVADPGDGLDFADLLTMGGRRHA